ncbi:MAG: glycosyl hydrolase [Bacteroidota bacterium]|nr:glycosyl hydrolase [Bacteroidota bacterium]
MRFCFSICFALIISFTSLNTKAQDKKSNELFKTETFNSLKFRSIGPAFMSGRITDFAVNPQNEHEYFVTVACGGVWKTSNSGITWKAVFDKESSFSIGCVTMDKKNPNIVWVGTGENNSQRSVSWGDGVYKSLDGGKSWKNMGLKKSEHIGNIIIHPDNSDIVYVSAQGPLWGAGGNRGLYKTTNGGKTWKKVLSISENTGVNEVVMDPRNPDVLIASSYQRRRHVWTLINGGPESAIYKSTNAGNSWKKIKSGIPKVELGRIGLAISPVNPDIVFAIIEAAEGKSGLFKSTDIGESWTKVNSYKTASPQYYNEIVCDPKDADKLYILDTRTKYSVDGGKTIKTLGGKHKHVDDHAIWINPKNTKHLLIGGDGGIYETFDHGKNWEFKSNFPVTQFYRVAVDNAKPFYHVYGGTQDNNTQGGPSQTKSISGIVNADWYVTVGGDGFESVIDPKNPNIVYSQSQYGWLTRFDKKTGEKIGIKPMENKDEETFRWNWDAPLIISPHSHTRLYFAANKVFRSDDRGNSWKTISPDLTKQLDRNKLKVMGKVWTVDAVSKNASTSIYGNIVSLDESPLVEGLIYVGTDDGLIQVSEDGGKHWRKEKQLSAIPEYSYVSDIVASQHNPDVVYATFDNHKMNDFKAYILKSTNRGKSWKSISSNLEEPDVVWSIVEDHKDPNLLFVGTEYGLFTTLNGGKKWIQLKSGLPPIAVRDIAIQKRENDLVLGTFGRGFYILDNYSPLRNLNKKTFKNKAKIFPIKDALLYIQTSRFGWGKKGSQGESYFIAPNPNFGATFTYYLKDNLKTQKQIRKGKEKKAIKNGKKPHYPTFEELEKEDTEEKPFLIFTIFDKDGNIVRKLNAPGTKGIHRLTWDLRYPHTNPARAKSKNKNESGFLVMPGEYSVVIEKNENSQITKLAGPQKFIVKLLDENEQSIKSTKELLVFTQKLSELKGAVSASINISNDLNKKIALMENALKLSTENTDDLLKELKRIKTDNYKIKTALTGNKTRQKHNTTVPQSINGRLRTITSGIWRTTAKPTQTQRKNYKIAAEEFEIELAKLKKLVEKDIIKLEEKLEKIKAPYTPGRMPEWKIK